MASTSRMKFDQLSHLFLYVALTHSSSDATNLQRVTDRFVALGLIAHDLSLEACDGVEEVFFKRRSQNLGQFPDYARFARRLVLLTYARQASNPSPSLFVNSTFSAFSLQKRISAG